MKYKEINKLDASPSLLGFGCMRFPTILNEKNERVIDYDQTEEMMDYAIKNGINYIDTAYPYHNGESEIVVGKILKKYAREKFYLATKLPMWAVNKTEDVNRIFNEQLNKLKVEYVDFYLFHAMNKTRFELLKSLKLLEECIKLKKQGKIKYIGFSFHDNLETFKNIIDYYDWDFCQIQLNYMDTNIQAGLQGLQYAESKNIPVIVMEPIKGGYLASFSDDVENIYKSYNKNTSIASWALRYVGSLNNVKIILSGMSNLDQVKDNINIFSNFKNLNKEEFEIIKKAKTLIESKVKNGCTGCKYCLPCPQGVAIPLNFLYWNQMSMYNKERIKKDYFDEVTDTMLPSSCVECGKCEKLCPQGIHIREDLKRVKNYFENGDN